MSTEKKSKKKKRIIIGVVILAIVGVIFWGIKNMTSQIEMTANLVEIEPVQSRDLSDSISLKGTVSGESKTNVVSVASAEITAVNVQVGDIVSEGDALVTLEKSNIEEQIALLKKNITNANAIAKNEAALRNQSLEQAKADQTTAIGRATDSVNSAQGACDSYQKKYNDCASAIEAKKNDLKKAEENVTAANTLLSTKKTEYDATVAALQGVLETDPNYATLNTAMQNAKAAYDAQVLAVNEATALVETLKGEITALEAQKDGYASQLNAARDGLKTAKEGYDDVVTSTNRNIASAQNTVDMGKYQSSSVDDLKKQLDQLEKQLEDCTLYAPCGGVVTAVNVSVGDNYTAGYTMITIEDTKQLKVIVSVEEANILKINEGMEAIVTTSATGEEEIAGTVTRVVRVKNQSTNQTATTTDTGYSAEIAIDNTELLTGMNAKARIVLKEKANVLAIPYDLIQYDEAGNAFVLVAEGNDDGTATAVRKNITVGEEVDYYTEILSGDLKEGDMLIYDYTYSIVEGQIFSPEQMYSEQELGIASDAAEVE